MDIVVYTYGAYLALSIGLTVWVAHTLSKNGALFLVDVFEGNKQLADAVNHLLVVGFYLINFGYISFMLKLGYDVTSMRESVEALSGKIGLVLIALGTMHFLNMWVFHAIRSGNKNEEAQPPVTPDAFTEIGA